MSGSVFPLSLITEVTLVSPALVPGVPNQSTICIVTQDATPGGWAAGQQCATYNSAGLAPIGTDFGVDSNTYAIAEAIYAQSPNLFAVPGAYVVVLPRLQSPSLEALPAAIARGLGLVYFYGVVIDQELADSDPSAFASLATYIETSGCLFFYASSNANDLNPGSPLDLVRQAGVQAHAVGVDQQLLVGPMAEPGIDQDRVGQGLQLGVEALVGHADVGQADGRRRLR